ncbi:hypothetical protein BH10ACT7_BH10ACT7_29940 [soil metagenome]
MDERGPTEIPDPVEAALTTSETLFSLATRSVVDALDLLNLHQYTAMAALEMGPLTAAQIADETGKPLASVAAALASLVEQGWTKEISPQPAYELTPHGYQLMAHASARRRADLTEILDSMPRRERLALARAFSLFARAAEDVRSPGPDRTGPTP